MVSPSFFNGLTSYPKNSLLGGNPSGCGPFVLLTVGAGVFVDVPAAGVDAFGVGALPLFLRLCPCEIKCDALARAPAAAVVDTGAIAS